MKVFFIENSAIFCKRLTRLLSDLPGIEIVGEAKDPLKAISPIRLLRPDVVILDMHVQRICGIDILQNIKKVMPAPSVIMLTNKVRGLYERNGLSLKVEFLLDKFTELSKIPDLLHRIAISRRMNRWMLSRELNTGIEISLRPQEAMNV